MTGNQRKEEERDTGKQFRLVGTGMGLGGRRAWVQILAVTLKLRGFE